MKYKKHSIEFLLQYGKDNYKDNVSYAQDGFPNNGKWYHRMDEGFVCGDKYTTIRFFSIDSYRTITEDN